MSQILKPESIFEILNNRKLCIPNYQRPYKWKVKNVLNLISDVEYERHISDAYSSDYRYRIGSIILHQEGNKCNVVDGQQRLLSICLILLAIASSEDTKNISLIKEEFTNPITLDNLKYNLSFIERYFKNWEECEKTKFVTYLLNRCEIIIIEASNISEAFQLFDSQNARGKTLEPADLLKAYHLRSMNDEHEKKMCVQRWEEAIDKKILHHVLANIIYRCRCWMRHDYSQYYFCNDTIDEFKGIDIDIFNSSTKVLPYMQRLYVMSQISSYSIDEPIVNGKRFFEYVDHYVSMYEELFPMVGDRQQKKDGNKLEKDNKEQDLVRTFCFYSPKMYRAGDSRLRNAMYCLLMSYFDKFGYNEYEQYFKTIFQYVYQLRLELSQIRQESIREYILRGIIPTGEFRGQKGNAINPFEWINKSYMACPSELRSLLRMPDEEVKVEMLNDNVR